MKPKTEQGRKLQRFNFIMGSVHLVQASAMLIIMNYAFKLPIITRFFDIDPNGEYAVVTETLVRVPIAIVGPLFLLVAAFFHFFVASPLYVRRYEANIKNGINPMRWLEYSISSSLMITALLMMGGLIELPSVVFIFTLNFLMNIWGLEMERYNQLTNKTSWFPFNIGIIAGIVPWIIGGIYFWASTNNIADSIPWYAQLGFVVTFLLFNTFAINMWLQYKQIGKWKNYVYGERTYIWLSLIAKSLLAWILVLGTLSATN